MRTGRFDLRSVYTLLSQQRKVNPLEHHFSPYELIPHSTAFAYSCKRLCEYGLLEAQGEAGRWGYFYKISESGIAELNKGEKE